MEIIPSIQQCPDCGKVISFSSDRSLIIICPLCGAVVRRKFTGELYTKPHWLVSNSNDIIQPGATGTFQGEQFTVLGRIRAWFSEAIFNYWTIQFSNGNVALLAEGYGLYSILKSFSVQNIPFSQLDRMEAGIAKELINKESFVLQKRQHCLKWELEGESAIEYNFERFRIYDLASFSDKHVTLFFFSNENYVAYETFYVSFGDLSLQHLRKPESSIKEIECKNCNKSIAIKTYPYAQSVACPNCYCGYNIDNTSSFTKKKLYKVSDAICIPLGAKGIIKNIAYEVIGYVQKEEMNQYQSQWREYTLYNNKEGFAFLSEFDGHWIYVRETCNAPVLKNQMTSGFEFNNESFQLFNRYNYKVVSATGEFPYNAFDNNNVKVNEFISPPEMWISENDDKDSITWFFGEHISPSTIEDSFQPCNPLPSQIGIGAVQPKSYVNTYKLVASAVVGILSLVFLHMFIGSQANEKMLLNTSYYFNDSTNNISAVTQKFYLDRFMGNLQFKLNGNVDNSWFSLNGTLVNADNGTEYSFEKGVEYYSGYSEGELWTEGSREEEAFLTNIPAGNYFLQIAALRENSMNTVKSINLEVLYDVPSHRNLGFSILLLLIWPAAWYYVIRNNETQRWSNSPFSTYNHD